MKKQKNKALWIGKTLLVLLMIFSQMYAPIEVFAEELANNEETTITEELNNKEFVEKDNETSKENTEKIEEIKEIPADNSETENEENKEESINENTETSNEENIEANKSTPEDTTETQSYTYKIFIDDEEKEEHTIDSESKKVTIKQSYDGEAGTYHFSVPNETEEIDFTNKLYGIYKKEYKVLSTSEEELAAKTITLNYEGDNSEILKSFANIADVDDHTISLRGEKNEITVEEILEKFDLANLQSQFNARIIIKDENGNELNGTDKINDKTKFILTNDEIEDEFDINIYGDYNNDKILNKEDAEKIVDIILETKKEEENPPTETILNAGNTIYWTGTWDEVTEIHDELTNLITNKSEVYRGEEFEVKYFINGFDKDTLNGIEGNLVYNKDVIELSGIEINKIYGDINDEGKFAYLLEDFHSEEAIMTIKFKAIKVGEANISIENILASIGGLSAELEETIVTKVTVIEAGKGGDVEEETSTPANTSQTTTYTAPSYVVKESSSYIRPIAKSSDSKIKYLEIEGYKIEFDPNKYNYSIKVKNSVKSLNLKIVLNDSNASYEVFGNENFKVGENTVKIVVTAEDGTTTSTYTINATREEKEEKEVAEKKSSKTIIIILIILVIIGLIYVIFKDDEEDKK